MDHFIVFYKFNFIVFTNSESTLPDFVFTKEYTACNDTDFNIVFSLFLNESSSKNMVVICKNGVKNAIKECLTFFNFLKAAGGIVSNPDNNKLLIYRNKRWDLPKGKVEKGECLLQTALREVEEETGLCRLFPDKLIKKTYHIYHMFDCWNLKQTSWYTMHINNFQHIIPQVEENIEMGEWVSDDEFCDRLRHSYAMLSYLCEVWKNKI